MTQWGGVSAILYFESLHYCGRKMNSRSVISVHTDDRFVLSLHGVFMKYQVKATLLPTISNPEHLRRINLLDEIDFTAVAKKAASEALKRGENLSDEYVERGILALKQYYVIAILDPANGHAVSPMVDQFWHAHMLFSKSYEDHCKAIVGEYMHHAPLDNDNLEQTQKAKALYIYTMESFDKVFRRVDRKFWPKTLHDDELICMHFGNTIMYIELQADRLFEPIEEFAISN